MRTPGPQPTADGVAGNKRLTSLAGTVLLALITLQVLSAVFFALLTYNVQLPVGPFYDVVRPVHFFVGFMLMPLIAIKLASTGYKFSRYYTRNPAYHEAGAPKPVGRLIAPGLVGSAIILVASGVEMWSYQNQFNLPWTAIHNVAAFTFVSLIIVHIAIHVREAHQEAAADLAGVAASADPRVTEPPAGLITRRAVIGGAVVVGAVLGVGASSWPFSQLGWLEPLKVGPDAMDFPVMNFEGGAQVVEPLSWRLRITGLVSRPVEVTEAQLLAMPTEEHTYSINCVDGWTAMRTWRGVPIASLLAMAGADPNFTHVQVRSTSGYHWDHERGHMLASGALLVTHINGVRLNDAHGYPARLMVPGLMGESNIKWVDGLQVLNGTTESYMGQHLDFKNPTITGKLLPRDPAGRRP